jgi:hypothetical protein
MLAGTPPRTRVSFRLGWLPPWPGAARDLAGALNYGAVTVTSVPNVRYGQIRFAGAYGSSTQPRLCSDPYE